MRGFAAALLLLIPANLLNFSVTLAFRLSGSPAPDGSVFAASYGIPSIVPIISIVHEIRLTEPDLPPTVPHFFGRISHYRSRR